MKRWRRWVKRGAIGAVAALVALALVGMTYQALATRADRRNFPPPGKLVDVGGHRLHIHCAGEGRPTVVLETGASRMSALWGWVQPQVAVHTSAGEMIAAFAQENNLATIVGTTTAGRLLSGSVFKAGRTKRWNYLANHYGKATIRNWRKP